MSDLDARLLAAHEADDRTALVRLYEEAARGANSETATGFYLTHAYVYALELNHPDQTRLRAALIDMGRETPI
jgi:hypothetical protein